MSQVGDGSLQNRGIQEGDMDLRNQAGHSRPPRAVGKDDAAAFGQTGIRSGDT